MLISYARSRCIFAVIVETRPCQVKLLYALDCHAVRKLQRGGRSGSAMLVARGEDQFRESAENGLVDVRLLVMVRDFFDALSPGR